MTPVLACAVRIAVGVPIQTSVEAVGLVTMVIVVPKGAPKDANDASETCVISGEVLVTGTQPRHSIAVFPLTKLGH